MASSLIHIAVAQKVNDKMKKDNIKILIGSIAPDISKLVGESKIKSHFLDNEDNPIPNLDKFLKKYEKYLNDDFVMGYYIHLYTDYLWFKYFMSEITYNNNLMKLDGTIITVDKEMEMKYIYNDYSNLNKQLIDKYKLNLDFLYKTIPQIKDIIEEIPIDKLNILIDKTIYIIENSKNNKNIIFNMENVDNFINLTVDLILSDIKIKKLNN